MTKINLGCGNDILEGYINQDIIQHRPEITVSFDLNEPDWWQEITLVYGEVDEIRAWDVVEHLYDTVNFMNNAWDALKKDGILDMKLCGWENPNYWVDITHQKAFDIKSMDYFDPDTELGKEYSYYTNKKWKILEKKHDKRKNILIKMKPIK